MATDPSSLSTEALLAESGWLQSLARQLVGDPAAADDLVQDTFVAALRRPPSVDRPLRPWLAKVARNLMRSRVRSDMPRKQREAARDPGPETPSPAELSEKLESQHLLVAAIRELDEPYRSTILLHYWEHLTAEEIARRLGIPSGTVRWRLKQGVDTLRQRLDARSGGDRPAWMALLVPLTRESSSTTVATSASIATGVLGMSFLVKASAALVLAVAVAAGWWVTLDRQTAEIVVPTQHEPVVFEPLQESETSVALTESNESLREPILETPAPTESAAVAATGPSLSARVVDDTFRPIAGANVRVTFASQVTQAVSDSRGEVSLAFAAGKLPAYVHVAASARGRVSVSRYETLRDAITYLGDLVLAPGGAVSGLVQDSSGVPIAGARVSLDSLDLPESELERRFHPFRDPHKEPSTATSDDGAFLLDGLPVGFARLLASDAAHLPGFTGVIEVRAGQESRGVVLSLATMPEDRMLRGVLLDPSDVAIARAFVQYRTERGNGTFRIDANGRFETLCSPNESFELFAEDVQHRWASIWLRDVRPGPHDVVMQFSVTRALEIAVTDSSDRPLTEYSVAVWTSDYSRQLQSIKNDASSERRATIHVPSVDFVVLVDEPRHWVGTVGPFTSASAPEEVVVALEAAPTVRGRVRDSAGPVSGARVRLFQDQRQMTTHNGFPVFVEPQSIAETTSASDGSFTLAVRDDGLLHVRAEAPNHAASLVGPLAADQGLVDVLLTEGGTIEGRVLAAPAQSGAGVIVAFSRGDACAFTRRTGPDGAFRVDALTPGRWMVQRVDGEILEHSHRSTFRPGRWDEIPSNCEVIEGRTTSFDLNLGPGGTEFEFRGELRVDGGAPGVWSATLASKSERADGILDSQLVLDAEGRFRARVTIDGDYGLFLTCVSGVLEGTRLMADVKLEQSKTEWTLDLLTAELELDGRASELPEKEHFVYSVAGLPGVTVAMRPLPYGEGAVVIAVPAGKGEIVRFHDETGPVKAGALPVFELRPGQTAKCKRP